MMTEEGVVMDREQIMDDLEKISVKVSDEYLWEEQKEAFADYILAREEQAKKDAVAETIKSCDTCKRKEKLCLLTDSTPPIWDTSKDYCSRWKEQQAESEV